MWWSALATPMFSYAPLYLAAAGPMPAAASATPTSGAKYAFVPPGASVLVPFYAPPGSRMPPNEMSGGDK